MSSNVFTELSALTPSQTARMVKEARLSKLLTQKELAGLAGISLRSLQRIENGEVLPRAYTWRQLAAHVDLMVLQPEQYVLPLSDVQTAHLNLPRKWIISFAALIVIVLSFSAFVIQSPTFPETPFETINMVLFGCVIYTIILYKVWK